MLSLRLDAEAFPLHLANRARRGGFHFFPGIGRGGASLGFGDTPLDFRLPRCLNLRIAGAVSALEQFPDKPIDVAGRKAMNIFENFGGRAVHG